MGRGHGPLGERFNLEVWRCKCGCEPAPYIVTDLMHTDERWRRIRAELRDQLEDSSIEIYITSGYRCASYNKQVGGAPKSQHVQGRAGDGKPVGASVEQLWQAAKVVRGDADGRPKLGGGIGVYRGWVHADTRKAKKDWDKR